MQLFIAMNYGGGSKRFAPVARLVSCRTGTKNNARYNEE
jgi:hypothetical protein